MKKKKYKKNQYIRYVELRTNKNKWTRAVFLKFKKGGKALFRLDSGEVISRKATSKIRWGIYSRYRVRKGRKYG